MENYREQFEKECNYEIYGDSNKSSMYSKKSEKWVSIPRGQAVKAYSEWLESKLEHSNNNRDAIFLEELEKRLPSEEEIYERKAALIDEGYNWDETAIELVKWLIQYLKNSK